jgi:phospholipase/carboxylesterase
LKPQTTLETLEVSTGPQPVAAVIWMHGLGADAHDFEPLVPMLDLGPQLAVRYVFPNAPVRPVTLNFGMRMRAWYDIRGLDERAREDEAGIRASAAAIEALVAVEVARGIAPGRIVLAGFSQGAALALYTGLRHADRLAGIVALSGYLPLAGTLAAEASAANRAAPIFMAHGDYDAVVPPVMARHGCEQLRHLGYAVDWRTYPMPHSVVDEEIRDIREFLRSVLGG